MTLTKTAGPFDPAPWFSFVAPATRMPTIWHLQFCHSRAESAATNQNAREKRRNHFRPKTYFTVMVKESL